MRICVLGAGALGGYFGTRLALAGNDVTFLVRGAHAAAMRQDGLRILSPTGDLWLEHARVLEPGQQAEPFDLALVTVKMYDLAGAAERLASVLAPGAAAIPFQNGVEAASILASGLQGATVYPGVAYIGGAIEAPGIVRHFGGFVKLLFGAVDGSRPAPLEALEQALRKADVEAELSSQIVVETWRKFAFLAPFAAITTFARRPVGGIVDDPDLWRRFESMVEETVAVGRASGVPLAADLASERVEFTKRLPPHMQSSMLTDLLAGRRLELDWLVGAVARLGHENNVAVPVSEATYEAIRASLA